MAERKPLMAGNWKMNLNHFEAMKHVQELAFSLNDKDFDAVDVAVLVPFTDLRSVQTLVQGDKLRIQYGAQDVSEHASGAYTGDISAAMLGKLDCHYVVVGHSERRQYHGETDALVAAKAVAARKHGITPIICVGEHLDIRKEGTHVAHCVEQTRGSLAGLSAEQVQASVIAYEPVWAIGTGEVATPEDAQEVCAAIRAELASLFDQSVAENTRILYGGSVKGANAAELMAQPDIDGALVGGASLDAADFTKIVRFRDSATVAAG
jgi:triosephosphate isomerase (TIM)